VIDRVALEVERRDGGNGTQQARVEAAAGIPVDSDVQARAMTTAECFDLRQLRRRRRGGGELNADLVARVGEGLVDGVGPIELVTFDAPQHDPDDILIARNLAIR